MFPALKKGEEMGDPKGVEIKYREIYHAKYKYQMIEDYTVQIGILGIEVDDGFISLGCGSYGARQNSC